MIVNNYQQKMFMDKIRKGIDDYNAHKRMVDKNDYSWVFNIFKDMETFLGLKLHIRYQLGHNVPYNPVPLRSIVAPHYIRIEKPVILKITFYKKDFNKLMDALGVPHMIVPDKLHVDYEGKSYTVDVYRYQFNDEFEFYGTPNEIYMETLKHI